MLVAPRTDTNGDHSPSLETHRSNGGSIMESAVLRSRNATANHDAEMMTDGQSGQGELGEVAPGGWVRAHIGGKDVADGGSDANPDEITLAYVHSGDKDNELASHGRNDLSSSLRVGSEGGGQRVGAGDSSPCGQRDGEGAGAGEESEGMEGVWDDLDASDESESWEESDDEEQSRREAEEVGNAEGERQGLGNSPAGSNGSMLLRQGSAPFSQHLHAPRVGESAVKACQVAGDPPRIQISALGDVTAMTSAGDKQDKGVMRGRGKEDRERETEPVAEMAVSRVVSWTVRRGDVGVSAPAVRWPIRGMECVDEGARELKERVMQAAEAVATQEVRGRGRGEAESHGRGHWGIIWVTQLDTFNVKFLV